MLVEPVIPFRLKIKSNNKIGSGRKALSASVIFAHLQTGQTEILSGRRVTLNPEIFV